jgi:hypothetical protein
VSRGRREGILRVCVPILHPMFPSPLPLHPTLFLLLSSRTLRLPKRREVLPFPSPLLPRPIQAQDPRVSEARVEVGGCGAGVRAGGQDPGPIPGHLPDALASRGGQEAQAFPHPVELRHREEGEAEVGEEGGQVAGESLWEGGKEGGRGGGRAGGAGAGPGRI